MSDKLIERLGKASHRLLNGKPGQTERAAIGVTCRVSADALEAQQKRIDLLEKHLGESLAVITDYLEYEHDGDPWTEDARLMCEMDINFFERDGGLKAARAALQEGNG